MSLCQQLCLLAFRALFENIRAPKRGRNAKKSLKTPCNGVIETPCAKNQVCKSIGVTCSTYRWFTKDKEENTQKWPKKGPQRAKNQNFEKQRIAFLSHVPRSIVPKNYVPRSKTVTCSLRTNKQTNKLRMETEYLSRLSLSSFCLRFERSNMMGNRGRLNTKGFLKGVDYHDVKSSRDKMFQVVVKVTYQLSKWPELNN